MTVLELIRGRLVLLGLEADDKLEAIRELVDFLVERQGIASEAHEPVLKAVYGRERFMSTGMEHGIAIPHGVTDAVPDDIACLGISRRGIPFETFDGEPAHIVFLLLTPVEKSLVRVRILSRIARILNCGDRRQRLCEAASEEEVLEVIKEGDVEMEGLPEEPPA